MRWPGQSAALLPVALKEPMSQGVKGKRRKKREENATEEEKSHEIERGGYFWGRMEG